MLISMHSMIHTFSSPILQMDICSILYIQPLLLLGPLNMPILHMMKNLPYYNVSSSIISSDISSIVLPVVSVIIIVN